MVLGGHFKFIQIDHFCLFGLFYIFDMLFMVGMGIISNKQSFCCNFV